MTTMQNKTFQEENDEVFAMMLDACYSFWRASAEEQIDMLPNKEDFLLQFMITGNCNQACEYCYLHKYQKSLYPPEYDKPELILGNLRKVLDYFVDEQKIKSIKRLDLFSGEIWGWPLGNQIFDILLEYTQAQKIHFGQILIPSNCSFVIHPKLVEIVEKYRQSFLSYGTDVVFSISFDGEIIDKLNRPFKINYDKSQHEYVDALYDFAKRNNYGFHPMIAAENIEKQKANYDTWIAMIKKYYPNNIVDLTGLVMQLEARSDKWDKSHIIKYLDWLNYVIDTDLHVFFSDDKNAFLDYIFHDVPPSQGAQWANSFVPYRIVNSGPSLGCSLGVMLNIRLGDLAIGPCHRTGYPKFILGKYKVENDKIVGVTCNNLPLANAIYVSSFKHKPKCDTCALNEHCFRSCLGLNYEVNQDLFHPVPEVCDFDKARMIFLYLKYCKLFGKNNVTLDILRTLYDKLLESEKELTEEWTTIIMSML